MDGRKLIDCLGNEFDVNNTLFIISTIQTIATLSMFGWLFKNYWHDLKRTVFFLSVCWTIYELVHYIR